MILDIIIIIILIVPMSVGLFRGFIYMLLRTFSWIGAVVAAFFLTGPVSRAMRDGFAGDMISDGVSGKIRSSMSFSDTIHEGLPDIISGGLKTATSGAVDIFSEMITNVVISVRSFRLIVFAVKLLVRFFIKPAARRRDPSILSATDKLMGLMVGFFEGFLMVFIFMALLIPVTGLASEGMAQSIVENLKESVIAGPLYDNNFLLVITGGVFS